MPDPKRYLKGFGLFEGLTLDGYKLVKIHITHDRIVEYRKYQYHVNLEFKRLTDDYDCRSLLHHLEGMLSAPKVIYTQYHNPYLCKFGEIVALQLESCNDTGATFSAVGECDRQFNH